MIKGGNVDCRRLRWRPRQPLHRLLPHRSVAARLDPREVVEAEARVNRPLQSLVEGDVFEAIIREGGQLSVQVTAVDARAMAPEPGSRGGCRGGCCSRPPSSSGSSRSRSRAPWWARSLRAGVHPRASSHVHGLRMACAWHVRRWARSTRRSPSGSRRRPSTSRPRASPSSSSTRRSCTSRPPHTHADDARTSRRATPADDALSLTHTSRHSDHPALRAPPSRHCPPRASAAQVRPRLDAHRLAHRQGARLVAPLQAAHRERLRRARPHLPAARPVWAQRVGRAGGARRRLSGRRRRRRRRRGRDAARDEQPAVHERRSRPQGGRLGALQRRHPSRRHTRCSRPPWPPCSVHHRHRSRDCIVWVCGSVLLLHRSPSTPTW